MISIDKSETVFSGWNNFIFFVGGKVFKTSSARTFFPIYPAVRFFSPGARVFILLLHCFPLLYSLSPSLGHFGSLCRRRKRIGGPVGEG